MKLKDLLSESSLKVLNRKFGEPLPTLEDTTKAYALKKEMLEGGPGSGPQPADGSAKDIEKKAMKAADDANAKMDRDEKEASASDKAMAMKGLSNMGWHARSDFEDEYEIDTKNEKEMQNFIGGLQKDELEALKKTYLKKKHGKSESVSSLLKNMVKENKNKDLLKVATTLGKTPSDVNSFLKKYDLEPDDLLDIIETGGRRYSMAILAAMKGNRRALRQLDDLLGFL